MQANQATRKELLEKLKQLADELGKSPSQRDMDQADNYPSSQTYKCRFKSWNHAKQEIGLETRDHSSKKYSPQELLKQLQRLAEDLGREPRIADLEADDELASFQTYVNKFGSWTEAKEAAGISTQGPHPPKYTDEELLEYLRDMAETLGRPPTTQDLRQADDAPTAWVYRTRFGSIPAAKRKAGLNPRDSPK